MTAPEPRKPIHVSLPPGLRREAECRRPGPNRDAILRLADELEAAGDHTLVPRATARAGLRAFADQSDRLEPPTPKLPIKALLAAVEAKTRAQLREPPRELEPIHVSLPPGLRREAECRRPGPNRDAILRLADELEAAGDHTLVPRATARAGLRAFADRSDRLEPPTPKFPIEALLAAVEANAGRELEPAHSSLPTKLRREADYLEPGPDRDAILRFADEVEAGHDA